MTIKEAEALTGMPRASIRFYESENLIAPEREKNGYRTYSQENIEDLLRIKLLRRLDISIEEIRAFSSGDVKLSDCLLRQMARLNEEQSQFSRCREVCQLLLEDSIEFHSLDPREFLLLLEGAPQAPLPAAVPKPENGLQKPGLWRRWFARSLDHSLYGLVWELILAAGFRVNLSAWRSDSAVLKGSLLTAAVLMALLLLFEPLFLSRWGTTPGKWIMGVQVTDDSGKKLTYRDAVSRCWTMLLYGYGLCIPIITIVRQIKTWQAARRGEEPEWEWDSQLHLRDKKRIRFAAYGFCLLLLTAASYAIRAIPEAPPNRGALTVAEFAENFNTLQAYYEGDRNTYSTTVDAARLAVRIPWELDASGRWTPRDDDGFYARVNSIEPPYFNFATDVDGCVTKISFGCWQGWNSGDGNSDDDIPGAAFQRHIFLMRIASLACLGAQSEVHTLTGDRRAITELVANWTEDFTFTFHGVTVRYDVEFTGCTPDPDGWPKLEALDGADKHTVFYRFTMELGR